MRNLLLTATCGLALVAGSAAAQPVTNLEVVDRPTLIIEQVEFDLGLDRTQDPTAVSRAPDVRRAIRDQIEGSMYGARSIIEETLGLEDVPQLLFDRPGNKAGVEQGGIRNDAIIGQTGGESGWAIINQLGEDNSANITQSDELTGAAGFSLNRSYVGQVSFNTSSGAAAFSQSAVIEQTHRAVGGDQTPNNAAIQQGGIRNVDNDDPSIMIQAIGENNIANLTQSGAGNDGLIQQGAENATTFRVQLGDSIGRNNRAMLTQVGFGNEAVISQEDDSDAITNQYGFDNRAYVQQDGDVDASDHFSVINQGGPFDVSGNFATVKQRALEAWSEIRQDGDDNEAYVDQEEPASYARSTIEQKGGSGNFASVSQSASTALEVDGVVSEISQDGSDNEAFVRQSGAPASSSIIDQAGDRNVAIVRQ